MKALIFGANGQDGWYLSEILSRHKIEPIGVSRSGNWIHADVGDFNAVHGLITQHKPDYIFHLAANSTTGHHAAAENHRTISDGALNILETVHQHCKHTKVFLSGSGLQFVNSGKPIHEKDAFHAGSPYAADRIYTTYLARYYRSLGLKVYFGYFFNHESPRRPERHMSRKIADAVKRIAAGSKEKIDIGDVSVKKEWTFAGDVMEGVLALVSQDRVFESVIGSGIGYSIDDWLSTCFELIGKDKNDFISPVQGFTPEYKVLVSDPETMHSLGWAARVSLKELARMMVQNG